MLVTGQSLVIYKGELFQFSTEHLVHVDLLLGPEPYHTRDLILGEDALLYVAYVMLILSLLTGGTTVCGHS